ncbi:hypothetical protein B0H34DRAFT_63630 [Crassisporium funariophilum]|nr:hypothetical protein B0H34DRAFT_63630 [Crassisporium funariophilum]
MDQKHQTSFNSYKAAIPNPKVIRSGAADVRERGTFTGVSWKPRRLELDEGALNIVNVSRRCHPTTHLFWGARHSGLTSQLSPTPTLSYPSIRTRVPLQSITELERTDLTAHSLVLATKASNNSKAKRYNISFATDPELYDWQDDIYNRCPLGGYSSPYNFVHKGHVGVDKVEGTFADSNVLPIFAEIMGGSTSHSQTLHTPIIAKRSSSGHGPPSKRSSSGAGTGIILAPRSRPASGTLSKNALVLSGGGETLEGLYLVKTKGGLFGGWKERWVTLMPGVLVVHRRCTKASTAAKKILLPNVTGVEVESDPKRPNCLVLEYAEPGIPQITMTPATPRYSASSPMYKPSHKLEPSAYVRNSTAPSTPSAGETQVLSIAFRSNEEMYNWREVLYLRSSLGSPIGYPTNFIHRVHVGFDPVGGGFTGLPTHWQTAINPQQPTSPPTSGWSLFPSVEVKE